MFGENVNVTDCLANTGGSSSAWLVVVGIAAVLIGLGVLALRRRSRAGTMLGALALIGALALVPISAPSSAFAATGDCTPATSQPTPDPAPTPDPTPDPETTLVSPEAPTAEPQCGAAPVIATPESPYFTYVTDQSGTTATVTAQLREGLPDIAVAPGAQTVWTFDLSFVPATVVTPESLAFTYGDSSLTPRITDASVAAFLAGQSAPLAFDTVSEFTYTYAVFTSQGDQVLELGETAQLTRYSTFYSAVLDGQDVLTTYADSAYINGYTNAQAFFEAQGGLPPETYIGVLSSSEFVNDAHLTATYVNECGVTQTVTATTPFVIAPV